jgi:hypothetical protein
VFLNFDNQFENQYNAKIRSTVTMSYKNKKSKLAEIQRLANKASSDADDNLPRYARALVSPKDGSVVFPSPTPSRAGSAVFPLVVEVSDATDFGIIVRPDVLAPLQLAVQRNLTEDNSEISGSGSFITGSLTPKTFTCDAPCPASGLTISGKTALPISSALGGNSSVRFNFISGTVIREVDFRFFTFTSGVWTLQGSWPLTPDSSAAVTFVMPAGVEFYAVEVADFFDPKNKAMTGEFQYVIRPIGPTVMTCAPPDSVTTITVHRPEWATLLAASQRASVVAADCLVTYEGSSLNNGGSISVCNTDDALVVQNSYYETVALRPHDMYRGRLASEGETEGGAHWHYVPDDPLQLILQDEVSRSRESRQVPHGYFGVKGKTPGEVVRIECHFMLNFYTLDPAWKMEIQPTFHDFASLIYAVRKAIPLVSSNDSHLKKLAKIMYKAGNRGIDLARAGIQLHDNSGDELAKAVKLMASLLA